MTYSLNSKIISIVNVKVISLKNFVQAIVSPLPLVSLLLKRPSLVPYFHPCYNLLDFPLKKSGREGLWTMKCVCDFFQV